MTDITTTSRSVGRPTKYSIETAEMICTMVCTRNEDGTVKSLQDICKELPELPDECTIYRWMNKHTEFRQMYARARETRADMMADSVRNIARTATDANLARVQIDAEKWAAAKLNPKRYSEKMVHAGDAENPLTMQVNIASQIMSTINGAGRPLPGASQEADRGNAEDADEPEVAAEQSVPH